MPLGVNNGDGSRMHGAYGRYVWPQAFDHQRACPTPSRFTTPASAAPSVCGPALSMSSRWFLGMVARLVKLLLLLALKIVWGVSAVRRLVPPISSAFGSTSEMKPAAAWDWRTDHL